MWYIQRPLPSQELAKAGHCRTPGREKVTSSLARGAAFTQDGAGRVGECSLRRRWLQLNKDTGAAGKGTTSSGAGEEASCTSSSLEEGWGFSWQGSPGADVSAIGPAQGGLVEGRLATGDTALTWPYLAIVQNPTSKQTPCL